MIEPDIDSDGDGDIDDADLRNQVPDNYIGLPDPSRPLIAVPETDLGTFIHNTSIEAYPDADGDGVQDQDEVGNPVFPGAESICNTASDRDEALSSPLRTQNQDTIDENEKAKPLISLEEINPGDFGELTLSFHLCDNPGYVWLQGANFEASENGTTEPERKDDDEGMVSSSCSTRSRPHSGTTRTATM